jgi:YidC/Oxa1 family membrane protein insertase
MDNKRLVVAIGLCIGVLVVWNVLFPPAKPSAPPPAPVAGQNAPAPTAPPAQPGAGAPGAPVAPGTAAPGSAPVANRPERLVELSTPEVRFVFSSLGGTLVHAQLREKQFLDRSGDPASGYDVVRTLETKDAAFRTRFPSSVFATPADGAWEASQPTPDAVVFSTDVGTTHIEKRYRLDKARYRLQLEVVVANHGQTVIGSTLAMSIGGRQDPEKKGGGFFSGGSSNISSALCFLNGKVERESIESLAKSPMPVRGSTVQWIGTDEKFFLLAAVPYVETPGRNRNCWAASTGTEVGEVSVQFQERAVAPNAEVSYPFAIFAGPKITEDLEAVSAPVAAAQPAQPGEPPPAVATPGPVNLEKSVDVTFAWLANPILSLLKFFHRFGHNWGLAIVLLTLFIKLVTFYPTQRSLLSAKKMQKLAPKMAAIRKKFENDRQRQSVETMNLYKAHGVSPFGGCLPSLIQMPIWIALYSTLNYAVELYRAPFIFHIHDLTAKDPFYITPLIMGGVMFGQMKMSPAGADPQQQAMMSVMMPIMFTGFSLFLPSGLAVYMLTSYLFGIIQQLYVNYLDRHGKITV